MIHEFYGVNESITGNAQALAEQGYVVVAPDTFRGSSTAWVPRAILQVITTPSDRVNQDLDAVFAHLQTLPQVNPERIAVQGFCYGGRAALTYSLHNPRLAATVIFYGSPETDPQVLQTLPGPVLGIFGGADTSIPVSEVRQFEAALEEAGIPHEISIYEDQPHAFVGDIASIRAGGPEAEAWQQMLTFLEQTLQSQTGVSGSFGALDYHQPFAWRYYLMLAYEHAFGSASHDH
jgi:carboxymethylenebutenolidase